MEKNSDRKYAFKLRLPEGEQKAFIERLNETALRAAAENSPQWFKKKMNVESLERDFLSAIKPSNSEAYPDALLKISFDPGKTVVQVTSWQKDGKLAPFVRGTEDDVKQGAKVLPILKVKSGVFFVNREFGISFVASDILVIKDEGGESTSSGFCMEDVEVADAEMADASALSDDDE